MVLITRSSTIIPPAPGYSCRVTLFTSLLLHSIIQHLLPAQKETLLLLILLSKAVLLNLGYPLEPSADLLNTLMRRAPPSLNQTGWGWNAGGSVC